MYANSAAATRYIVAGGTAPASPASTRPRHARAETVRGQQRVEAAALAQLAGPEGDVHAAARQLRPAAGGHQLHEPRQGLLHAGADVGPVAAAELAAVRRHSGPDG